MPADSILVVADLDDEERREVRWKARSAVLEALTALPGEARRADVLDRALTIARFSPRELDAPPPASAARRYTRMVDHALSWALTNLKRDGLVENPRRAVWGLSKVAREPVQTAGDRPLGDQRLAELRAMPYGEYLRTQEWRRTRAAALLRAGNRCALDAGHTDRLEVHHNTYERLGAELARDLIVLCHSCHRLHHKRNPAGSVPPPGWVPANAPASSSAPPLTPGKHSLLRRLLSP